MTPVSSPSSPVASARAAAHGLSAGASVHRTTTPTGARRNCQAPLTLGAAGVPCDPRRTS